MKNGFIVLLAMMLPVVTMARAIHAPDMQTLIAESKLVFVGHVEAIESTGITTSLSYPAWRNVVFTWLNMRMKVIDPIKGVNKGDIIQTVILSMDRAKAKLLANPPGMLAPRTNEVYLLCLLPTTRTNLYAAFTAPYDDCNSIFRSEWTVSAEEVRLKYANEINTAPKTNAVIHLEWETFTAPNGWQHDVPKGNANATTVIDKAEPASAP